MKTHAGIDRYIAKAGGFAQPILTRLRAIVHAACPKAEEAMKWRAPHFTYNGLLCSMAAFQAHCVFGFWKSALIAKTSKDASAAIEACKRLTSPDDLPTQRVLTALIKAAMRLNDDGVKDERPKKKEKGALVVPDDLMAAMKSNPRAIATFEGFSPSHKREYVDWITEAKGEDTRQRRLETAIEWMAQGKSRHWNYAKC
jgi:uncharacterized protein YdeI (YjbR/CyaY-like superfamily)